MAAISSLVKYSFFGDIDSVDGVASLASSKLIISSVTAASSVEILAQGLVWGKMISLFGVFRNFLRTMSNRFRDTRIVLGLFSFLPVLDTRLLSDRNARLACQRSFLVYYNPNDYQYTKKVQK
jgi:hypothetical protein